MTKEMIKAYIEDHQEEEEKPEITVHDEFQS
jgi:hypothetical protein